GTTTAAFRRTSAPASAGSRSTRPSAYRVSRTKVFPSTWPKAVRGSVRIEGPLGFGAPLLKEPTSGSFVDGCPEALSGAASRPPARVARNPLRSTRMRGRAVLSRKCRSRFPLLRRSNRRESSREGPPPMPSLPLAKCPKVGAPPRPPSVTTPRLALPSLSPALTWRTQISLKERCDRITCPRQAHGWRPLCTRPDAPGHVRSKLALAGIRHLVGSSSLSPTAERRRP